MSFNKKLISLILAFVMVLVALPLTDLRSYATDPSDFTYAVISENDKTAELTGYTGSGGDVVIPSTIDGYTIISIGDATFGTDEPNFSIVSLSIPSSIDSISVFALAFLANCSSFSVDSNNTTYSSFEGVLYNKNKTELVRYPAQRNLASFDIVSTVTSIGFAAVSFSNLSEIIVPYGVRSITDFAFAYSSVIERIVLPDSLIYLGGDSFDLCSQLNEVVLPTSLDTINSFVFYGCSSLYSLVIPDNITSINSDAFAVSGLTTIYGVSGSYAESFANNNSYTFIDIGTLTKGDMNNDNLANPSDIDIMLQLASGNQSATAIQLNLGDLNNDGVVDGFDAAALDRKVYENVD